MMSIKQRVVAQRIFVFLLVSAVLFGFFTFALAQVNGQNPAPGGQNPVTGGQNPPAPGTTMELANPLKAKSIDEFILNIIEVIMVFLIPIIVLYIMYAGFLFVTARGNATQIADAKRALLYAIIGGVIVVGAKLIIDVIQGTVDAFKAAP